MSRFCDLCDGAGETDVPEWVRDTVGISLDWQGPECWACRGKGWRNMFDRVRVWNSTNARGSFPKKLKCVILGHKWMAMETFRYCHRCRACWDREYQEAVEPKRF